MKKFLPFALALLTVALPLRAQDPVLLDEPEDPAAAPPVPAPPANIQPVPADGQAPPAEPVVPPPAIPTPAPPAAPPRTPPPRVYPRTLTNAVPRVPVPAPVTRPAAAPGIPVPAVTPNNAPVPAPGADTAAGGAGNAAAGTAANDDSTDIVTFKNMPLDQFLDEYATISRRTVLRAAALPLTASINFKPASKLTQEERLQMYDTILALNGITMIPTGEKAVLAVPSAQAVQEGAAFSNRKPEEYAEASQFVTTVVKLEHIPVQEAADTLKQFAKNPNGIVALESTKTIILRDYAINVKRMLEVLKRIDIEIEQEYQFEVIPVKFGKVEELYQTLSSVIGGGGGGGSGALTGANRTGNRGTLGGGAGANRFSGSGSSFGNSGSRSGYNQGGNYYGQSDGMEPLMPQQAAVTRAPTTTGAAGSFQQRFNNVNRAGAGGQNPSQPLQGEANITPDLRSNSLIIYASKKDMAQIKKIVAQVDTLLAQVLIEAVIMEVALDSGLAYGISAVQRYRQFNNNLGGAGAFNIGSGGLITNLIPTAPTGSGLNYLLRFNDDIDVLVKALASDASVNVLQRPRIVTTHAVPASFFVGSTVPFIQGTSYGTGASLGGSSYYDRQNVGVNLDVLPYITSDGLVLMEVQQDIEEIAPNNDGVETVANAPVTNKRTATSTIAVKTGESVLLGGFIRASKSKANSGIPLLKDIPLLGNLFRSNKTDKSRVELMILMRPTVLPTPEAAAEMTKRYQQESPQIRMMEQDFRKERERLNKAAEKQIDNPLNSDGGLESVLQK